ncbi:MAG: CDP-alcohol phosphatidyltransferase family protein [Deinococcaceae bacterium]
MDSVYVQSLKPRPRIEYLNAWVYRPLAHLVVKALLNTSIKPPHIVFFHTFLGLMAAREISKTGGGFWAALLINLKTVLDNADGQLARARKETSEMGRYLDTEMDWVVNAALFYAIGTRADKRRWSVLAFAGLNLILTLDFQWEAAYQRARGKVFRTLSDQIEGSPHVLALLQGIYSVIFSPQDRLVEGFDAWRCRSLRISEGTEDQLAYTPAYTTAILSNFGLSTQMAFLSVFLIARRPVGYLWSIALQWGVILCIQYAREAQVKRHLKVFP